MIIEKDMFDAYSEVVENCDSTITLADMPEILKEKYGITISNEEVEYIDANYEELQDFFRKEDWKHGI